MSGLEKLLRLNLRRLVIPRVGPVNATGLLQDAQLNAFREILIDALGVPKEKVEETVRKHLKQTAQGITNAPVPSPIRIQPLK